jgi:hypothetical protein
MPSGQISIQVQYEDGSFWLTQKRMAIIQNEGKQETKHI